MPDPDLIISTKINQDNSRKLLFFSYSERGKTLLKHMKKNI